MIEYSTYKISQNLIFGQEWRWLEFKKEFCQLETTNFNFKWDKTISGG